MTIKRVDYSILKTFATDRALSVQWIDYGEFYWLGVINNGLTVEANLNKTIDQADVLDFETTLKTTGNAAVANALMPFASANGFRARFKGINGTAAFGATTNIEHPLTEERWIDGVEVTHVGAAQGDTVNFQIVHPTYGVVDAFGSSWNIDSTIGKQGAVVLNYPAKLAAGLTIRCAYVSVGTINVWVGINLRLHKKT